MLQGRSYSTNVGFLYCSWRNEGRCWECLLMFNQVGTRRGGLPGSNSSPCLAVTSDPPFHKSSPKYPHPPLWEPEMPPKRHSACDIPVSAAKGRLALSPSRYEEHCRSYMRKRGYIPFLNLYWVLCFSLCTCMVEKWAHLQVGDGFSVGIPSTELP